MLNVQKYKGVLKEYVQCVFDVKGIKEHVHYVFAVEGIKMTIFGPYGPVIKVQSKTKNARRRDCFMLYRVVRRKIKQNQTTTKSNIAEIIIQVSPKRWAVHGKFKTKSKS